RILQRIVSKPTSCNQANPSYQASRKQRRYPPSPRLRSCVLTHGPQSPGATSILSVTLPPAVERVSQTSAAFLLHPITGTPITAPRPRRINPRPLASRRRLHLNRNRHIRPSRPHSTSHASCQGWTVVLPPPPSGNSSRRDKGATDDRLCLSSVFVLPAVYALRWEWYGLACRPRPTLPPWTLGRGIDVQSTKSSPHSCCILPSSMQQT
ncbi:hypothetical protein CORC01_09323, partial [Colletotrichum orchidophilum]